MFWAPLLVPPHLPIVDVGVLQEFVLGLFPLCSVPPLLLSSGPTNLNVTYLDSHLEMSKCSPAPPFLCCVI